MGQAIRSESLVVCPVCNQALPAETTGGCHLPRHGRVSRLILDCSPFGLPAEPGYIVRDCPGSYVGACPIDKGDLWCR